MAATAQQKMAAAQTKMAARKRVVSECASIIADPTQVKQGQIQTRLKYNIKGVFLQPLMNFI